MADTQETYTDDIHGREDAQSARNDRDHQQSDPEQHARACEASIRARQRRADAEIRREKRWERWRARETAIVQRVSVHQPGPQQDARDHRGEVV